MKRVALAGNPNCGKTTLFNSLTGATAHVGNWPGVTVDKLEGVYKKTPEPISIVDLPGIYSLSPYTSEEVISRNYILDEKPDCVINIVDATNLERNLYLTTQLMEIDVPVVIALNMMDEVTKAGVNIDVEELEKKIGLPVCAISALKQTGLEELMQKVFVESGKKRKGETILHGSSLAHLIQDCQIALEGQGVDNSLFHAVKLVELDELEVKQHPTSTEMVEKFKATFEDDTFGGDFEAIIADERYKYISTNYSQTVTKKNKAEKEKLNKSDKIDKVLTHKIWGIPIFLVILFFVFHLTFAEDMLFLGKGGVFDNNEPIIAYTETGDEVANPVDGEVYFDADGNECTAVVEGDELVGLDPVPYAYDSKGNPIKQFYDANKNPITVLEQDGEIVPLYDANGKLYEKVYNADGYEANIVVDENGEFADVEFASLIDEFRSEITVHTFFGYEEGVYSPGVILFNTLDTFTGFLTACVNEGLVKAAAPEWVIGFVCDGILGGLFAVLSFLPQILLLFLFFSILENSGYMARVAFILDRIFRRFGLSGRAFMPMIMGFGCSIPAMINTRTLAEEKEKIATIRVIPFFSCGAKLPILTAIAGAIVAALNVGNADLITYGMYVLGMVVAICSVLLMRNTTLKGETPPFIMELPQYRWPQFKSLVALTWDKIKHFVKKAFTIILLSTIAIWFISHFSWGWRYLPDEQVNMSILGGLGQLIQPLFTPLGFGSQIGVYGWVFAVAAVTGLIAKENVIATFGTLAACLVGAAIDVEADGGIGAVSQMVASTGIGIPGLIAFIAFNMLTIPCFAAVATAKAELDKKSFRGTLIFWILSSYIVASMIYLIGSWWWTVFIFVPIWAAVITLVVLNNKGKINMAKFFGKLKIKKQK
ncbi:MAG: ferrous iron transporter B [Clostridia bacterium]|nr:ferrous iron transporter B [Clostridia bacterium]